MDMITGGGGTPEQNYGQQAQNMTNAENTAFSNNQQAVNSSLAYLSQWLGANPSPVSSWGNITAPSMYGPNQTLGGGGTNALGALVNAPANLNTPRAAAGTPGSSTRTTLPVARRNPTDAAPAAAPATTGTAAPSTATAPAVNPSVGNAVRQMLLQKLAAGGAVQ